MKKIIIFILVITFLIPLSVVEAKANLKIKFKEYGKCDGRKGTGSKFEVILKNKMIGTVSGKYCNSDESKILAENAEFVYFTILPSGLGGYINHPVFSRLYQVNPKNNNILTIIKENLNANSFSSGLKKIAYDDGEQLVIMNLATRKQAKFAYPEKYKKGQINSIYFSPKADKIAFLAMIGPDDERSAVYFMDIKTGEYKMIREKKGVFYKIIGWKNNDYLIFK